MGYKERTYPIINKTFALATHELDRFFMCKLDSHSLYRCKNFMLLSPTKRLNLVQKQKLCVNCFNNNHQTKRLTILGRCQNCKKAPHFSSFRTNVTNAHKIRYIKQISFFDQRRPRNFSGTRNISCYQPILRKRRHSS